MNIAMQIKLNKISQIPAEIFKKLCKDHRFEPTFWDIFKYLLMRCAHFSMLLMRMKPINFIFSKSMYIVSEYQSTSRHQFEQYFNFVQQLTLPVVETRGFTKVLIISQENTVSIKKDRAVSIEAEFSHNHVPRLVSHLPRMLDIRRFTKPSFSPHEDRPA